MINKSNSWSNIHSSNNTNNVNSKSVNDSIQEIKSLVELIKSDWFQKSSAKEVLSLKTPEEKIKKINEIIEELKKWWEWLNQISEILEKLNIPIELDLSVLSTQIVTGDDKINETIKYLENYKLWVESKFERRGKFKEFSDRIGEIEQEAIAEEEERKKLTSIIEWKENENSIIDLKIRELEEEIKRLKEEKAKNNILIEQTKKLLKWVWRAFKKITSFGNKKQEKVTEETFQTVNAEVKPEKTSQVNNIEVTSEKISQVDNAELNQKEIQSYKEKLNELKSRLERLKGTDYNSFYDTIMEEISEMENVDSSNIEENKKELEDILEILEDIENRLENKSTKSSDVEETEVVTENISHKTDNAEVLIENISHKAENSEVLNDWGLKPENFPPYIWDNNSWEITIWWITFFPWLKDWYWYDLHWLYRIFWKFEKWKLEGLWVFYNENWKKVAQANYISWKFQKWSNKTFNEYWE